MTDRQRRLSELLAKAPPAKEKPEPITDERLGELKEDMESVPPDWAEDGDEFASIIGELIELRAERPSWFSLESGPSLEDREILEDYCAERSADVWQEAQALTDDRADERTQMLVNASFYSGVELALQWVRGQKVLESTWAEATEPAVPSPIQVEAPREEVEP